tara:strand:+ start:346 stop:1365 length:1020 start_codon:yes stop_codon:yes gene_type:complete
MTNDEMTVPRSALMIVDPDHSTFELRSDEKDRAQFRMVANSGDVIENHPHWGNFAIDFDGLKIGRQRKPALRDHDPQRIVGHTFKIEVTDDGLVAEGTFLDTKDGMEVQSMMASGFPWQASVYVPPKSIERLEEGESSTVNGREIHGPAHVFRQASLREVTFTSLGADENTGAASLSEIKINAVFTAAPKEEKIMEPEKPEAPAVSDQDESATDEQFAERYDSGVEDGIRRERERVNGIIGHCLPDQLSIVTEIVEQGVTQEEGVKRLMADVKEGIEERLAHKLSSTPEPVGPLDASPSDPRSTFEADTELSAEFGTFEVWEAYTKAIENGRIVRGKAN